MKASKKVFVVTEYGGEYEDKWTDEKAVFATKELAKQYVQEWKDNLEKDKIPEEIFNEVYEKTDEYFFQHPNSTEDWWKVCHKINPNYSVQDYENAEAYYRYDKTDLVIKEIDYYE